MKDSTEMVDDAKLLVVAGALNVAGETPPLRAGARFLLMGASVCVR